MNFTIVIAIILAKCWIILAASTNRLRVRDERIIGGHEAKPNSHPYIVSLQLRFFWVRAHICGGSILTENWILTAGHCITESWIIRWLPMDAIAGAHNVDKFGPKAQIIGIDQRIPHPLYKGGIGAHDIAVLKTKVPIKFTKAVQPVNLPQSSFRYENLDSLKLSGWGALRTTLIFPDMPTYLQEVDLTYVPFEKCYEAFDKLAEDEEIPLNKDSNMCTGPITGGVAACSGDSGGPLVYYFNTKYATDRGRALRHDFSQPKLRHIRQSDDTTTTEDPDETSTTEEDATTTEDPEETSTMEEETMSTSEESESESEGTTEDASTTESETMATEESEETTTEEETTTTEEPEETSTMDECRSAKCISAEDTDETTTEDETTTMEESEETTSEGETTTTEEPDETSTMEECRSAKCMSAEDADETTTEEAEETTTEEETTTTEESEETTTEEETTTTEEPEETSTMEECRSGKCMSAEELEETTTENQEETTTEEETIATEEELSETESTTTEDPEETTTKEDTTTTEASEETTSTTEFPTTDADSSEEYYSYEYQDLLDYVYDIFFGSDEESDEDSEDNDDDDDDTLRRQARLVQSVERNEAIPMILGVVSWGVSPCGEKGAPTVYTKVSSHMDFINQHIY